MFSKATMKAARAVADRAKSMWTGAVKVGFDFVTLITLILGFLQTNCKPKTEASRESLIKSTAQKCSDNGVAECIDCCMSEVRANKLRKKMANKLGLKTAIAQDQHFFNAVMAANSSRSIAVAGMTSAYDNDESDEDD